MSKSKRIGTAFETLVVLFLRAFGFRGVERRALNGILDRGDIAGIPDWTLECKNEKSIDLAGYMKEAEREAQNAGTKYFAAVVKRRNHNVSDAYVVMPLRVWASFVKGTT